MLKDNLVFSKKKILKKRLFLPKNSAQSQAMTKKWLFEYLGVKHVLFNKDN